MNTKIEPLNSKSPIPLYYQLKTYIEEQINKGNWEPGTKILSEPELSNQFKVSRTTVRQAIGELVNEGKLKRTQGRGTFVSEISIYKQIERISGFTWDMRARGLVSCSKILTFEVITPPPHIVEALQIQADQNIIKLKRLRLGNQKRIALETMYLPYGRFKSLMDINIGDSSVYEILGEKYDLIPTHSTQTIEAIRCPAAEAEFLGIPAGFPVFLFKTVAFDQFDQPFEYTEGFYRGDRYILHQNIVNNP